MRVTVSTGNDQLVHLPYAFVPKKEIKNHLAAFFHLLLMGV
jgi:hypothetical protein